MYTPILTKNLSKNLSLDELLEHINHQIQKFGFGVLYHIDFGELSLKKRNIPIGVYRQLGICHPDIWFWFLDQDKSYGALLPCPLCIYEEDTSRVVSIVESDAQLWIHPSYTPSMLSEKASCLLHDLFASL